MILGNLYFIKNTNGLFYYGADYLREHQGSIREILVRPALEDAARAMFPDVQVVSCRNAFDLYRRARVGHRRGDVLYTPTPHPLPLLDRQWIIVHDAYPFTGSRGRVKRMLLRLSLSLSRCRVGYINESETLDFVKNLGLAASRLIFAPNKVSEGETHKRPPRAVHPPLKVGLVGTDSPKKRYDELLSAVQASGWNHKMEFHVYGHRTPYYDSVCARQSPAAILLHESDRQSLPEFLDEIDLLASVADLEGFGRPIAAALQKGIPCYLLKKPVFMEFFSTARFFDNTEALVEGLVTTVTAGLPEQPPYTPPLRVRAAYQHSNEQLRAAAAAM